MTRKWDPEIDQYRDKGKFAGNDNAAAAGGMNALGGRPVSDFILVPSPQASAFIDEGVAALKAQHPSKGDQGFEDYIEQGRIDANARAQAAEQASLERGFTLTNPPVPQTMEELLTAVRNAETTSIPVITATSPCEVRTVDGGVYFSAPDDQRALGAWDRATSSVSVYDRIDQRWVPTGKADSPGRAEEFLREHFNLPHKFPSGVYDATTWGDTSLKREWTDTIVATGSHGQTINLGQEEDLLRRRDDLVTLFRSLPKDTDFDPVSLQVDSYPQVSRTSGTITLHTFANNRYHNYNFVNGGEQVIASIAQALSR